MGKVGIYGALLKSVGAVGRAQAMCCVSRGGFRAPLPPLPRPHASPSALLGCWLVNALARGRDIVDRVGEPRCLTEVLGAPGPRARPHVGVLVPPDFAVWCASLSGARHRWCFRVCTMARSANLAVYIKMRASGPEARPRCGAPAGRWPSRSCLRVCRRRFGQSGRRPLGGSHVG